VLSPKLKIKTPCILYVFNIINSVFFGTQFTSHKNCVAIVKAILFGEQHEYNNNNNNIYLLQLGCHPVAVI
jgi:hypothetical protein